MTKENVIKTHEVAQRIASQFTLIKKGNSERTYTTGLWRVYVTIKWNRHRIKLKVIGRHIKTEQHFTYFKLRKAYLLSLVSRSETYNSKGVKSALAQVILSSPNAQNLMYAEYPKLVLNNKQLEFFGTIHKQDKKSLSNIFTLFDALLLELEDALALIPQKKTTTQ